MSPERPKEVEFDFGYTRQDPKVERAGRILTAVSDHVELIYHRYPSLFKKIQSHAGNPHMYDVLHRDFAVLKRELHQQGLRVTRGELADAFRTKIEADASLIPGEDFERSHHFYTLFGMYHQIVHRDPGLKELVPRREDTDNRVLIRKAPLTGPMLAHIATTAARKEFERSEARIKADFGPEVPREELRFALMAGASAAIEAFETQGHPLPPTELRKTVDGLRKVIDEKYDQIAPRHAKALPAPRTTAGDTQKLVAALGERHRDHQLSLAARETRMLPAPDAQLHIESALTKIGVPDSEIPKLTKAIGKLGKAESTEDAVSIANQVVNAVHNSAKHWIANSTPPVFAERMRALLRFVGEQPYHPVTESAFTDLRKKVSARKDETLTRAGAAKRDFDYGEFYAKNPKVAMAADYESALHGLTATLAEQRAKQKPFG